MTVHSAAFPRAEAQALLQHPQSILPEPTFSSEALLKGRREILIQHGDRVYRLRHTSNDKLILTK